MFRPEHLNDSVLKKLTVEIPIGQFLFRQNEKGNTMYVIISGNVQILHRVANVEHILSVLGPGEVVGERAISVTTVHKRTCSALAVTDLTLFEFDSQSLKLIQAKVPDFTLKMLGLVTERLDRANQMLGILQLPNPIDRMTNYMLYCCEHLSKRISGGLEITLTAEDIHRTANVPADLAGQLLKELIAVKVLTQHGNGYLVADEQLLLQAIPTLKDRLAA